MSEIQQCEQEIKNAKELIERRRMALKLADNPEFKKLFLEEYFVNEAARLVQISADPNLSLEQRADALAMAQATGHTKRYLSVVVQMGAHHERALPELEAHLDELRAVEAND